MSAWERVLDDVAARGGTPEQVSGRLALPMPLVLAVLDHAERLGIVAVAGQGCGPACPTGSDLPTGCIGCPLTGSRRASSQRR